METVINSAVVSELLLAGSEASSLTLFELARLLQRSATTIQKLRDRIQIAGRSVACDRETDIVFDLKVMATSIELFPPEKVSAMLIEAAEAIEVYRLALDE